MAFSSGRNEIQASIEDDATMLSCAVQEINLFYSEKLSEITCSIEKTKSDYSTECPEILASMLSSDYQVMEWYEELLCLTLNAFIPKVYSYAEKHIEGLLGRIPCTLKNALNSMVRRLKIHVASPILKKDVTYYASFITCHLKI